MPKVEELKGWLSRLLQPVMLIPLLAIVIVSSIVAGSFVPGPRCGTVPDARGTGYVIAGKSAPATRAGGPGTSAAANPR